VENKSDVALKRDSLKYELNRSNPSGIVFAPVE